MALVIPALGVNCIVSINNGTGGDSGDSSIAFGIERTAAGWGQTDANRVANLFRDGLKGLWDSTWAVGPVRFIFGPLPYTVLEDTTTELGTGTAAVYSPPAVSLIVSKKTAFIGRQHRGRVYLPGVPETLVDDSGLLDATYVSDVQTLFNALFTSINADASVAQLELFHDSETPGALAPTPLSSFLVRNVVGTMRPRQRR